MIANNSRRLRFTGTLSIAASLYGAVLAYRLIGFQADAASDVIKFTSLIFVATAIISFFWWTIILNKFSGLKAGALAGLLSVITIIPIPTFLGGFKKALSLNPDIILAAQGAIEYSISTISLAEYLAIPPSIIVGIWAARP